MNISTNTDSNRPDADTQTLADRFADTSRRLQDSASGAMERVKPRVAAVTTYVRDERMKTLLIAAACGAVVMGIVTVVSRSNSSRVPTPRGFRRMAQDAVDQASQYAQDRFDRASSAAGSAAKSTRSAARTTSDAASSALDGLSDTVKQWRDQAAPLVERFQPQIDSVTAYAKSEPAKSALLVAAAGALLAGLVSLAGSSDDD